MTTGPVTAGPDRRDPDVLVVGGGVVGLFCAYYLRLAGASVTVLERGPVGGPQSCSSGNTGFVGTQGATPLAEPGVLTQGLRWLTSARSPLRIKPRLSPELAAWLWYFRRLCNEDDARRCFGVLLEMKRRSLEILRELAAGSPDLAAAFTAPGMIVAFRTEQGFERACRSVPQAVARGVPLRVLGDAELRELEPEAEFDIHGALFNAEGAALRTPEFVVAFAGLLERMGVTVRSGTQVTGFDAAAGKVRLVRTTGGDFTPGEVVLAAGAWSAPLARMLDVRLMLQPAKGYAVTVRAPAAAPRLPVLLSEGKVALMPLGDRLRFGGTLELAGLDATVSRRRIDGIVATVRSYLPGLEVGPDQEVWSGLRPCTPDSLPLLGRAGSYRNLSVACGHGYIGMGLAPVGGRLIAQVVAGEQAELDLTPLRAGRFGRS
ncbi:MAG TPA: FAD-dependent oxidoreductase [Streptosporangiaceae bacterium]